MNNGQTNKAFLDKTTKATKDLILGAIARHYGCSKEEIYAEVTDSEAEHLLEYMTGSERAAASVLMQKHSFR